MEKIAPMSDDLADIFDQLYRDNRDMLYKLALGLTGNSHDAEEVTQEAFLRAFRSYRDFREECAFSTWIYRIAINVANDYLRQRTKFPVPALTEDFGYVLEEIIDPNPAHNPETELLANQIRIKCLHSLTECGAAIMAPEKVVKIVCLSVPTVGNFGQALLTNPTQQRRSWYMYFFQLPFAEKAVAYDDFQFIEQLWQEWSPGWHCPQAVMDEIKSAFRHPSVLKAALGYYRSQFNPALQQPDLADMRKRLSDPVPVSAMHLHGADDGCIGAETTAGMESAFSKHFEKHIIPAAGHFVHQEQPDIVNRLIIGFLQNQR